MVAEQQEQPAAGHMHREQQINEEQKHTKEYSTLLSIVRDKDVFLATHWDCDGVTAGALIYHLIKEHAKSVDTISKGDVFLVMPEDIKDKPDVIICVDIKPSQDLLAMEHEPFVVSVDHHPNEDISLYPFSIHDETSQSCSMLVLNRLVPHTQDPYHLFLGLLGFFGDGGRKENIPAALFERARRLMPELLVERESMYRDGTYMELERHVSAMNVGKRMFWNGELPLALLKDITHYRDLVENRHPLALQIAGLKEELRTLYETDINVTKLDNLHYAVISSQHNIQGVLCARHMDNKPIIVLNRLNNRVIGSMRCPSGSEVDAGEFLSRFNDRIGSFMGGGHREAAGFTLDEKELSSFMELLTAEQKVLRQ